jgi:type I restriction enzyme R subunit
VSEKWTEQETRSRLINPAISKAGWDLATQVREDFALTAGRIISGGRQNRRERPKRADYVLYLQPNVPIAPIEAKDHQQQVGAGMQQALAYARMLDVPFAFSTNGREFLFHDGTAGPGEPVERVLQPSDFPTPEFLWERYRSWKGLDDSATHIVEQGYHVEDERKALRYYQAVAVNRVVEAVAAEQRRLMLVMATGTGKTLTAFQIMWRLRKAGIAKRILFLVDRNVLADQALVNDFTAFGQVMTKVTGRKVDKSYEVYLALYQAIVGADGQDAYKQFSPDFFDLIVIDECHRGSAAEDSAWRVVLDYFGSAVQIGLTATPKETKSVSNIEYFGEPIYTYSLRDGIADGFLAPYTVRRIGLDRDLGGWRPTSGQLDRYGNAVPDRIYTGRDYDRTVILDRRSPVVAESITEFMKSNDRYAKTIVFCEDIEHAERMRQELVNANSDITAQQDKYVVRITGDSDYGAVDLEAFMDPESKFPVIVTTSKLLTTGVDVPTCKVIAIDQTINSMTEFKQIIGRGTRVREELGKTSFTILDYRGATQLFADPEFDGEPRVIRDDGDGDGGDDAVDGDGEGGTRNKFYVDGVDVTVLQERVQYFDRDGKMITESLAQFTRERALNHFPTESDFLAWWLGVPTTHEAIESLVERGILVGALEAELGTQYDVFDLVRHVAYGVALVTREERVKRVELYLQQFDGVEQSALSALAQLYVNEGPTGIEVMSVLRIKPLSDFGTPVEIISEFGGRQAYTDAVAGLLDSIYSEVSS